MQVTELESALAEANSRLTRIDEADKRLAGPVTSQPAAAPAKTLQHKPADSNQSVTSEAHDPVKPTGVNPAVNATVLVTAKPSAPTSQPAQAASKSNEPAVKFTEQTPAVQKQ